MAITKIKSLGITDGTIAAGNIADNSITNAKINASAAIAKSKLAALDITNSDINGSAAIAKSKLAALDIVNADINSSAAIAKSKLGALAITNSDVDNSAAIAQSKMAALTAANLPAGYGTDLVGVIISYPKDTLPTGFLACDGSAVSRTTYSDLFAVVGTTYGTGNGSSTFNVPDLRAAFLRGSGDQTYSSKAYSGGTAGTKKIQSINNFQARTRHTYHNFYAWADIAVGFFNPHSNWGGSTSGTQLSSTNNDVGPLTSTSSNRTYANYENANSANDETRPFGMAVKFCIKY